MPLLPGTLSGKDEADALLIRSEGACTVYGFISFIVTRAGVLILSKTKTQLNFGFCHFR